MSSRIRSPLAEAGSRPGGTCDADWIGDVDRWPSRRPSLAYQWALDVSAAEIHRQRHRPVLIAAHPVLGPEAARRLGVAWGTSPLAGTEHVEPARAEAARLESDSGQLAPQDASAAVIWVEPTAGTWHPTLDRIEQLLGGAGYLLVLTSSPWLARGLPEWVASGSPSCRGLLGGWAVVRRLRAAGWSIESTVGMRGLCTLSLGVLSRLAAATRRDALADRLSVRMRQRFVERGRLAGLSTVTLVGARPPAGQLGR